MFLCFCFRFLMFLFNFFRANATNQQQDQVNCRPINTETSEIWIANACDGRWEIHNCPPVYISIEGPAMHDGINMRCTERECRFPDNARFSITGENLGCFSGVGRIVASLVILAMSLFMTVRF
jgi:hypothetical protein